MKELCVVHLVRVGNDIELFRRFMASYAACNGGVEHDLLIMFKGFSGPADTAGYQALLEPFPHRVFHVSDEGFDITAYFAVIRQYGDAYRYFCFLNSHSVLLDEYWLRKLHDVVTQPGVGLAGATGSWNSHHANAILWFRTLFREVGQVLGFKTARAPDEHDGSVAAEPASKSVEDLTAAKAFKVFRNLWVKIGLMIHFKPFPNFHLRTNAFIVSGELMATVDCPVLKTKIDALTFESGRRGLSMQMVDRGLKLMVVGRDGQGYDMLDWDRSGAFWTGEQENLLVADNQTRDYAGGTIRRRSELSYLAWGRDLSGIQHTADPA